MQALRKTISKNLAKARRNLHLSQGDLAKLTGLMPSAVAHFEAGRRMPTVANLLKLADALVISLDSLFGRGTPRRTLISVRRQQGGARKRTRTRGK